MKKLTESVYLHIKKFDMINESDKLVVGLSGGADSVCLLLVLCELRDRLSIAKEDIFAVHINHMLRENEADKDEAFSRELCEKFGVNFVSFKKDIKKYANEKSISLEEAGRIYRYKCFGQVASENNCTKIAVAHNKNDLAETVIFNIARGTGLKGMSGIPAVRDNIVRPLLNTTRQMIIEYLEECEQPFKEDASNFTLDYDRNRIRHVILPELMNINSAVIEHISQISEEARNSYAFIHDHAISDFEEPMEEDEFGKSVIFNINKLVKTGSVLQDHLIHEAITKIAGKRKDVTRKHVNLVLGLIYQETGKMVELPYGIKARRNYNNLIVSNKIDNTDEYFMDISNEGIYNIPGFGDLEISHYDMDSDIKVPKNVYTKMIDYDKIYDAFCVRTPMDGDYIVIDNKGSTKKLSRVFIDNKIDREKRKSWPVVACGQEIIWAIGLRYNEAFRVGENTKKVVHMNFTNYEKT